jgi:uncharacterized Tic20 family protein
MDKKMKRITSPAAKKISWAHPVIVAALITASLAFFGLLIGPAIARVCMQNVKKWLNWSTWETVAT